MKLTTVLILTNSQDVTSDYLCNQLSKANIPYCRFNTDIDCPQASFTYQGSTPQLNWNGNSVYSKDISTLVFRRPKPIVISQSIHDQTTREHLQLEWSEALEGFLAHIDQYRWINHPSKNYMASHKIEQLTCAQKHGLKIPETIVTNDRDIATNFVHSHKGETVVKPLASGFIERDESNLDTLIYTNSFQESDIPLLVDINKCPVLFQRKIVKKLDVRVTVIDQTIISVGLQAHERDGSQKLDIRRDNMCDVKYILIDMPQKVQKCVMKLLAQYELRFAALDFAITHTGEWFFFEINPNGQWAWLDEYVNKNISSAFIKSLKDASFE